MSTESSRLLPQPQQGTAASLRSMTSSQGNYDTLNTLNPVPSRTITRAPFSSSSQMKLNEQPSSQPMGASFSYKDSPARPASVFSESSPFNTSNGLLEPNSAVTWEQRLPYYLPLLSWAPAYTVKSFLEDCVAGCSLASFQIPLALSYATSVAHVPALCGLYSLAIPAIIYVFVGSVPRMIVGPESAICLVIGQAVEPLLAHNPELDPVDLVSVLSCIGGFYLLGAGLCRFGFLDNVLSRALLRGFISAVGLVMVINSLYDELGVYIMHDVPNHFHSPLEKMWFLLGHLDEIHVPSFLISAVALFVLVSSSLTKSKLISKGYANMIFVPEILIVVIASTFLSYHFDFKSYNVRVMGKIKTEGFTYKSPFTYDSIPLYKELMSSGFLAATLGFFESTTASKALGSQYNLPISSNRELVALGAINIFGGIIGALPAFGGYGRSRINALSGAQTTMSGGIMGVVALLTIRYLLGYVYYLPVCVLSVITTMIGCRLLEEAPSDIAFHWRARGYSELLTFLITIVASVIYSVEAGVALGVAYSVIKVIQNSSRSRIQILARVPGTVGQFVNADDPLSAEQNAGFLEEIENCLIVKIAEPLTFSNTADMKQRLIRLEKYGSTSQHPAAPRTRAEYMNRNIVFDLNGMTYLDSSAAQILYEVLKGYKDNGNKVYFVRVPTKHGVRERLVQSGITALLTDKNKFHGGIEEVLAIIDEERFDEDVTSLTDPVTV
ncbi:hypothetical protein WICPIJ_006273 [Wickerhamomyces pijperi]|uniref:STAS domain-containing protein n=1 Tax=Wickerhamomyces pijperi TaxID=599730 RepID=A0A9P8TL50_WICPI|nr:hypothetical protein WICPIJ_006273 [Wickerhamomyces pijperi]